MAPVLSTPRLLAKRRNDSKAPFSATVDDLATTRGDEKGDRDPTRGNRR